MTRSILPFLALVALLAAQSPAAAQTKSAPRSVAKPVVTTPVNINTANAAELDALPGVGAKTAALIVEYRQKNGPFTKVEDLMNVRGIGEKGFLKVKDRLTTGPARPDGNRQP